MSAPPNAENTAQVGRVVAGGSWGTVFEFGNVFVCLVAFVFGSISKVVLIIFAELPQENK